MIDVVSKEFKGTVTNGVYTTGDQSIGGIKTFNSTLKLSNNVLLSSDSSVLIDVANKGFKGTASTLETARNIGGASFNGSANISIQFETIIASGALQLTEQHFLILLITNYIFIMEDGSQYNYLKCKLFNLNIFIKNLIFI